jgi:DNA-binding NarL/FixJ family response regulator
VIFSTSGDMDYIEKTFHDGAHYYARKPRSFELLKKLIDQVLAINFKADRPRLLESFLLNP